MGSHTVKATATDDLGNVATDSTEFTVVDRNGYGGGFGCTSSGGTPSSLAMMSLAVSSFRGLPDPAVMVLCWKHA